MSVPESIRYTPYNWFTAVVSQTNAPGAGPGDRHIVKWGEFDFST